MAGTFSNPDIKTGTLRYCGSTDFAEGTWAGVELDAATGRNNGSVNGKRYLNCPWNDNYGLFIRSHVVKKSPKKSIAMFENEKTNSCK